MYARFHQCPKGHWTPGRRDPDNPRHSNDDPSIAGLRYVRKVTQYQKQLTGNAGLYYVCFELSQSGWNAMPTARNAKGVDIVIYSELGRKKYTIQVKSQRQGPTTPGVADVSFGKSPTMMADYMVVCRFEKIASRLWILTEPEFKNLTSKDGRGNYWFSDFDTPKNENAWDKIGKGFETLAV